VWYQKAFPDATLYKIENTEQHQLQPGNFCIEIVQSDTKVGSGKSGTVLYWLVPDLNSAVSNLTSLGFLWILQTSLSIQKAEYFHRVLLR